MIIRATLLVGLLLANWAAVAWTQDSTTPSQPPKQRRDVVAEQYFSPDMVLQNEQRLNLTSAQKSTVEELLAAAQMKIKTSQEKLQGDMSIFGDTVEADPGDKQAIQTNLKTVLEGEVAIKMANLMLLVSVYNQLNQDQRLELQTIKQEAIASAKELQQRIQQKIKTVQTMIQQQAQAGQPPKAIIEMMKPFNQLLRTRQGDKAEALLDQALRQLKANKAGKPLDVDELFK